MRNTFKSFSWTFVTSLLRKIILFVVFIIVANTVSQEDLGVFREFTVVIGIFVSLSYFGFKNLLIIKRDRTEEIFSLLLVVALVTSLISMTILFLSAPLIGKHYHSNQLTLLCYNLPFITVLESFRVVWQAYYHKKLSFKRTSIFETINVFLYSSLILILYFFSLNVTTLVIVFYIGNLAELLLYCYYEKKILPRVFNHVFKGKIIHFLKEIIKRDKKYLINSTINDFTSVLASNTPIIVLGLLFKPAFIGVYYLANQLISQPITLICNSLAKVLFPTFTYLSKSEIKDRLTRFYNVITLIAFPLVFLFVIYLIKFVPIFLDEKWISAIPVMLIIAVPITTNMLVNPVSSIPEVFEVPQYETIYFLCSIILSSIALVIGSTGGPGFALLIWSFIAIVMQMFYIFMISKILECKAKDYYKMIAKNSLFTIILILIYWVLKDSITFIVLFLFTISIVSYVGIMLKKNGILDLIKASYGNKFKRLNG